MYRLIIALLIAFNVSCAVSTSLFSRDHKSYFGDIPNVFKTGIIFYTNNNKPLIINEIITNIYSTPLKNYDTIAYLKWNYKTAISLSPGKYIITTKVPYFGRLIWKSETEIEVNENIKREIYFKTPSFTFNKLKIDIY
jgi:hypothetical protein